MVGCIEDIFNVPRIGPPSEAQTDPRLTCATEGVFSAVWATYLAMKIKGLIEKEVTEARIAADLPKPLAQKLVEQLQCGGARFFSWVVDALVTNFMFSDPGAVHERLAACLRKYMNRAMEEVPGDSSTQFKIQSAPFSVDTLPKTPSDYQVSGRVSMVDQWRLFYGELCVAPFWTSCTPHWKWYLR